MCPEEGTSGKLGANQLWGTQKFPSEKVTKALIRPLPRDCSWRSKSEGIPLAAWSTSTLRKLQKLTA